ncbi:MAG: YicC family protein [Spirochaeta sp.]|jgi:uncharacterized protein (TIGR00255 family)|nr:YicC family protein [Spirochaeta sp.]
MIHSMTGYAYTERSLDERDISIEIRSVNNRYLEISSSLPGFLTPLDPEIRAIVSNRARRGKVEVSVRLREYADTMKIHVDRHTVAAAREALREIADAAGITDPPGYQDILTFEGVVQTERKRDLDLYREFIFPILHETLDAWEQTRLVEGTATVTDIKRHIARLTASLDVFIEKAPHVEEIVMRSVRDKFREILGDEVEEQRVMAEAAALAVKHGTNEEMVRLQSHVAGLNELLTDGGGIGKRRDFVCQEINRELNTTGSKTVLPEVQNAVVEAKDAVEAIREQVRNIE